MNHLLLEFGEPNVWSCFNLKSCSCTWISFKLTVGVGFLLGVVHAIGLDVAPFWSVALGGGGGMKSAKENDDFGVVTALVVGRGEAHDTTPFGVDFNRQTCFGLDFIGWNFAVISQGGDWKVVGQPAGSFKKGTSFVFAVPCFDLALLASSVIISWRLRVIRLPPGGGTNVSTVGWGGGGKVYFGFMVVFAFGPHAQFFSCLGSKGVSSGCSKSCLLCSSTIDSATCLVSSVRTCSIRFRCFLPFIWSSKLLLSGQVIAQISHRREFFDVHVLFPSNFNDSYFSPLLLSGLHMTGTGLSFSGSSFIILSWFSSRCNERSFSSTVWIAGSSCFSAVSSW